MGDDDAVHVTLGQQLVDALDSFSQWSLVMFSLAIWNTCSPLALATFFQLRHSFDQALDAHLSGSVADGE